MVQILIAGAVDFQRVGVGGGFLQAFNLDVAPGFDNINAVAAVIADAGIEHNKAAVGERRFHIVAVEADKTQAERVARAPAAEFRKIQHHTPDDVVAELGSGACGADVYRHKIRRRTGQVVVFKERGQGGAALQKLVVNQFFFADV